MVSPEDIILRPKLKVQILSEIERVVKSILSDTPKSESRSLPTPQNPSNCVLDFLFPLKTFHLLQENGVLPESVQGMRIKYELDSNRLLVLKATMKCLTTPMSSTSLLFHPSEFGLELNLLLDMVEE